MTQYGIWGNLNLFVGMVAQIWLQNNYIVLPCKVGAVLLVFLVACVCTDSAI